MKLMRISVIAVAFLFGQGLVSGQSQAVQDFEERAEGYKLFLYQSVLRTLNQDGQSEFNELIKDLDHIRLVTQTKTQSPTASEDYERLDQSIASEGYESIMEFDRNDGKIHVYEQSRRKEKTMWFITFVLDDRVGVMEMKGQLNLKYISALGSLNFDKLKEMLQ